MQNPYELILANNTVFDEKMDVRAKYNNLFELEKPLSEEDD